MKKRHDEIASIKREESYSKVWFNKALGLLKQTKINFTNVIDIGAGKGEFLELLNNKFKNLHLYAIDYTDTNLGVLERKGINNIKIDLDNFELERFKNLEKKFDLVTCLAVVEHIFDLDRLFIFFNRILKCDGYLLISTPNMASFPTRLFYLLRGYPYGENHHIRFLTKRKIEQYSTFTGFNIIKSNNYFALNTGIIKRGFGIRNKYLVNALAAIFFGPFWIFSKFGILDSLSNTDIVLLAQKNNLPPLGLELHDFQANFEHLDKHDQKIWKSKIKEYLKRDKMKEYIHFPKYLVSIVSGNQDAN